MKIIIAILCLICCGCVVQNYNDPPLKKSDMMIKIENIHNKLKKNSLIDPNSIIREKISRSPVFPLGGSVYVLPKY
jgi:hypothetical protein